MTQSSAIKGGIDLDGKRVLIVRLSALGDVIRTLPAVTGLQKRFPDATFFWLVEKPSAGILAAVAGIQTVVISRDALRSGNPLRRWRAIGTVIRRIRALKIDVSLDFHGVLKSGLFPWLARIPLRIGFESGASKEGHRWMINCRFTLANVAVSRYERNRLLAQFIHETVQPQPPVFHLDEASRTAIAERMTPRPIIFFPGTSAHGQNKRWPTEYWALLFEKIATKYPVQFMFGPADQAYRESLANRLGSSFRELPSSSLAELAHTLLASRFLVACDTGPLHLAAVLNVPVVAMLGPSNPILNQPQTTLREVILPGVACAPCRNRGCTVLICQDATTPKRVVSAVDRLLERTCGSGS